MRSLLALAALFAATATPALAYESPVANPIPLQACASTVSANVCARAVDFYGHEQLAFGIPRDIALDPNRPGEAGDHRAACVNLLYGASVEFLHGSITRDHAEVADAHGALTTIVTDCPEVARAARKELSLLAADLKR